MKNNGFSKYSPRGEQDIFTPGCLSDNSGKVPAEFGIIIALVINLKKNSFQLRLAL
jgi:hypothetical protein